MVETKPHIVVVTGLSGSGKSTAIKAFEDIGYFCIDNLPVPLLPELLKLSSGAMGGIGRIALGIDIRGQSFLEGYDVIFQKIEEEGYFLEIIFLEAVTEILQRRYSQTRRLHPIEIKKDSKNAWEGERFLFQAIEEEKKLLASLRKRATRIIDTTNLTVHLLKQMIVQHYGYALTDVTISLQILSFGYKYGVPLESDIVIDLRFLPNPYFVESLKNLTGCDSQVSNWIMDYNVTKQFIDIFKSFLDFILPCYIKEGKKYLTISFGCTGGKHRSVAIAEYFKEWLKGNNYYVKAFHRDINNE